MKLRLLSLLVLLGTLAAFPVFAIDLHQARNTGQVGEKADAMLRP